MKKIIEKHGWTIQRYLGLFMSGMLLVNGVTIGLNLGQNNLLVLLAWGSSIVICFCRYYVDKTRGEVTQGLSDLVDEQAETVVMAGKLARSCNDLFEKMTEHNPELAEEFRKLEKARD